MSARQQPLFFEVPPGLRVLRVALEYEATPLYQPEDEQPDGWYRMATGVIERLLAGAPDDLQAVPRDHLTWVRDLFRDLAESQAAGFLADHERVDISDVEPIDDTPYDEEQGGDDGPEDG